MADKIKMNQVGEFPFRNHLKEKYSQWIQVKKEDDKWVWYIDIEVLNNLELIEKAIPNEFKDDFIKFKTELTKRISAVKPVRVSFSDVFGDIKNNTRINKKVYEIRGDIIDSYINNQDAYAYYVMIGEYDRGFNLNRRLSISADKKTSFYFNNEEKRFDLQDYCVKVVGEPSISQDATIRIRATSIEVIGPCSRLRQITAWEKECQDLFLTEEEQNNYILNFNRVAVIAREGSRGCKDFFDKLKEKTKRDREFKLFDSKMIPEDIQKKIDEINREGGYQYICIVRGGGDPEQLIEFSNPQFLRTVAFSKIPVITGIAHTSDNLLCDKVAKHNAGTPSGAAGILNQIAGIKDKKIREEETEKTIQKLAREKTNWEDEYRKLLDKYNMLIEEKESLLSEIDRLKAQIPEKKKGFFSWF